MQAVASRPSKYFFMGVPIRSWVLAGRQEGIFWQAMSGIKIHQLADVVAFVDIQNGVA